LDNDDFTDAGPEVVTFAYISGVLARRIAARWMSRRCLSATAGEKGDAPRRQIENRLSSDSGDQTASDTNHAEAQGAGAATAWEQSGLSESPSQCPGSEFFALTERQLQPKVRWRPVDAIFALDRGNDDG
jgi:hypothetical protein